MSSNIQKLLSDKEDRIDYEKVIKDYPWILEKSRKCILSPDSDGLLCGLFMSKYLDWKIVGFYDGKIMILKDGISVKDCVFLDMEIFRKSIISVGHHMVLYNKRKKPTNWFNFDNCIQPNNMRNYDGKNNFRLKYPLASIHLLIGILGSKMDISVPESALCPLYFVDGTFNVLFKYPENVLNWLHFLRADELENPLHKIFENEKYTIIGLMRAMDSFFRERDKISITNQRGDRMRISDTDGKPINLEKDDTDTYKIDNDAKDRIIRFLSLLSKLTGWKYNESYWNWNNFKLYKFTKLDFKGDKKSVCNKNYDLFILQNPLSWAMTTGQNIEYTLEKPDKLF
jgi:hypothetical protein